MDDFENAQGSQGEQVFVTSPSPEEKTALTKAAFTKTAYKTGFFVALCFALRYIGTVVITLTVRALRESVGSTPLYIIEMSESAFFLQILPSVIGAFLFGRLGKNGKGIKTLYSKPKSLGRAIGNFPAVYGLGQAVNLLVIIITFIFTSKADIVTRMNSLAPEEGLSLESTLFLFLMLTVTAPLFEEFIFRGLLLEELKPFGNGLAIFTTAILFGVYHGNFQQMFFATAIGIALGYIADVTGSILPTTILHAMVNSLGGIMQLLMTSNGVQEYLLKGNPDDIPDADMIWVAVFGIFMVSVIIFIIVGLISAFMKFKQIRRYKVPKVCAELSNGRKTAMLLLTVPGVIALVLIFGTYSGLAAELFRSMIGG